MTLNDLDIGLYIVLTEYLEPAPSNKITTNDYRVLATSVIEAANVVQDSCFGTDETVAEVKKASHITSLSSNKFKIIKV